MDNPTTLLGVIQSIWRWRKQIIRICGITAIGSVVICLLLPNFYKSSATFYAASPNLAFPEPVGLETRVTEYYGETEDMDRILTIAESKEVADYLIDKFGLYDHYEIDSTHEKSRYKVMKRFRKYYTVERTKFNAIEISIEDKEKEIAMNMVNAAWMKINEIGQTLIKEGQRVELMTREKTVLAKEAELKTLSDSLSSVRERYSIYNPSSQAKSLSEQLSLAETNLLLAQAKKKTYSTKGGKFRDSVTVANAMIEASEQQVTFTEAKLKKLNEGMAQVESMSSVHQEAALQLGMNRERLSQLRSTLESEFTAIYLVSGGELPINKSRPIRSVLVLASVFLAFLFSVLGILAFEAYNKTDWKGLLNE